MSEIGSSGYDFKEFASYDGGVLKDNQQNEKPKKIRKENIIELLYRMFTKPESAQEILQTLTLEEQQIALNIGKKWHKQVQKEAIEIRKHLKKEDIKEAIKKQTKNRNFKKWALENFSEIQQSHQEPFLGDQIGEPGFTPPSWWT